MANIRIICQILSRCLFEKHYSYNQWLEIHDPDNDYNPVIIGYQNRRIYQNLYHCHPVWHQIFLLKNNDRLYRFILHKVLFSISEEGFSLK